MIKTHNFLTHLSLASSAVVALVLLLVVSTGQTAEAATNSTGTAVSGGQIEVKPDWGMIQGAHLRDI